jgi:DNA-binding protein WhiA
VAAMTPTVKDELSRLPVGKACCRRAEMAVILRFAGGLHLANGRVVVEAELDTASVARRLRSEIAEVFGHPSEIAMLAAGGLRRSARWLIRVDRGGESLARSTGLIAQRGRPVRGLPPMIVTGGLCDAAAAWRGAFLAHGSLTEPGRSSSLEITSPGPEAALALVGAARRLGIQAKSKQVRGVDRVVIRDAEAIGAMLTHMGAHDSVLAWEERRMRREVRATANRLANFDDANLRRSARAAVAAGARVSAAMDILSGPSSVGDGHSTNGVDPAHLEAAPEHLLAAGELRLKHPQASLEELGALADPPMTKDAVAGRIRRLLALADKRALALGLPTTEAAVSPELLEGA